MDQEQVGRGGICQGDEVRVGTIHGLHLPRLGLGQGGPQSLHSGSATVRKQVGQGTEGHQIGLLAREEGQDHVAELHAHRPREER